jgi:hypothetical protein
MTTSNAMLMLTVREFQLVRRKYILLVGKKI